VALKDDLNTTITGEIKEAITKQIDAALQNNIQSINQATQNLNNHIKKQSTTMNDHLHNYKTNQHKFFQMAGVRNIVFWIGIVFAILTPILLLVFILMG